MKMNCASDQAGCTAKCIKIAVMVVVGIAALGWVVMLLWNWLMPNLFIGARPVDYWQAMGILLLSKILFGGHGHGHYWKARREHWEGMTPEEREQLKDHFKSRWGMWCKQDKTASKATVATDKPANDTPPHGE